MADPTADLERLRAIAEKMTPGKRTVRRDPTLELRCKAVSYQYEYEPGEFASVWLAREMKDADAEALATFDRETLLALLARTDGDDGEPVTVEWLESLRMQERGLRGMTMVLPPVVDGHAIAELCIAPGVEDDEWTVTLIQGVPDDPKVVDDHVLLSSLPPKLTRGHVRRLLAALGIPPDPRRTT